MRLGLDKIVHFWGTATPNQAAISTNTREINYASLYQMIESADISLLPPGVVGLIVDDNVKCIVLLLSLMKANRIAVNIGRIVKECDLDGFLQNNGIKIIVSDKTIKHRSECQVFDASSILCQHITSISPANFRQNSTSL